MHYTVSFDLSVRYLHQFWCASGDFWQLQWDNFLDLTDDEPVTLWVYGTTIFTFLVYWLFGGIFTILDITNKPKFLRQYKVQPGTNEPVNRKKLIKVVTNVLINQTLVTVPFTYFAFKLLEIRGCAPIHELPKLHSVVLEIVVFMLTEELGLYYSHRLHHSKYLYKYIHKQHHEWTSPIAVTAIYCHPIEHIFNNLVPPFSGVFVMGSHIATAWLWFFIIILSTITQHSGYHFPFLPSPEAHDFHHFKFINCFGAIGVLDRLHGTDRLFRRSKAYARHKTMLSFIPPREAFPDLTTRQ